MAALHSSQHSPPAVQRSYRRSRATFREPPSGILAVIGDFGTSAEFGAAWLSRS
jgi:hypothetical protein